MARWTGIVSFLDGRHWKQYGVAVDAGSAHLAASRAVAQAKRMRPPGQRITGVATKLERVAVPKKKPPLSGVSDRQRQADVTDAERLGVSPQEA